ncbi:MAG: hypothetical protein IAE84_06415 [Saprospiraceae bacterium]|nr:hypothetical protein [Saprospiraceae bacterium]HRJ15528.1 hypothetical protein [Saprospiraceae bacterium]HRK81884.1 hypothetical protein [Saprospiraceae bacterium]
MRTNTLHILFGLLLSVALIFACTGKPRPHTPVPAFYHWKNKLSLSAEDASTLQDFAAKTLYIRYFDVQWSGGGALPVSVTKLDWASLPEATAVIPVVFITNETFRNLSLEQSAQLAAKTAQKIQAMSEGVVFEEVQIDCDWSACTRERYFLFLNELRKNLPSVQLSVTIRLHQVKYRTEAGIPPADRGMMMPYNLENPARFSLQNSIYDSREAAKYLRQQPPYPLPCDVALPLFSWGVQFRGEEFRGFLHGLRPEQAQGLSFLQKEDGIFYRVTADTLFQNLYLRRGDRIKTESVSTDNMAEMLRLLAPVLPNDSFRMTFFHLDQPVIHAYDFSQLQKLAQVGR